MAFRGSWTFVPHSTGLRVTSSGRVCPSACVLLWRTPDQEMAELLWEPVDLMGFWSGPVGLSHKPSKDLNTEGYRYSFPHVLTNVLAGGMRKSRRLRRQSTTPPRQRHQDGLGLRHEHHPGGLMPLLSPRVWGPPGRLSGDRRNRAFLQLWLSLNAPSTRSLPHILFPARCGCLWKNKLRSLK